MSAVDYHQTADGLHIITVNETEIGDFESYLITDILKEIHHNSYGKRAYVILDLQAHYRLPLREFVTDLKQFYFAVDGSNLRIALIVQPSVVRVIETMVKTLVTREAIQHFTDANRAQLWLEIERKKNAA